MGWFLRRFLPPLLLLPVLRHLIYGEPLPLHNNTFRWMRAVETHLHLWDHVGWLEARPFIIAGMAFVMSLDPINLNHEAGKAESSDPLLMYQKSRGFETRLLRITTKCNTI